MRPLKHAHGCFFNLPPERLVQAVPRHDVGLTTKDARSILLHIHQLIEAELSPFVVEKQVNVGISCASPRAVEPNM